MTEHNGADKPLLSLSTVAPQRPTISIDGTLYELKVRGEFSLLEQARFGRMQGDVSKLMAAARSEDGISDEQVVRLRTLLEQAVSMLVVELPTEVVGKLTDQQLLAILQAFPGAAAGPRNRKERRAVKRTSGKSSPASAATTATTAG